MSGKVEASGTAHGLDYDVWSNRGGYRCGYVRIPEGHALFGVDYSDEAPGVSKDDIAEEPLGKRGIISVFLAGLNDGVRLDLLFDVHGGLTFGGSRSNGGGWWLGFDCAHCGDAPDPDLMDEAMLRITSRYPRDPGDVVRSLDYVRSECESLAAQIVKRYPLALEGQVQP